MLLEDLARNKSEGKQTDLTDILLELSKAFDMLVTLNVFGSATSMGLEDLHYLGSVPSWVTGHR